MYPPYWVSSKEGTFHFENPQMGIYFIEDPDHYWLEIIPNNR